MICNRARPWGHYIEEERKRRDKRKRKRIGERGRKTQKQSPKTISKTQNTFLKPNSHLQNPHHILFEIYKLKKEARGNDKKLTCESKRSGDAPKISLA
jgi:hypothetical protein